MYPSLNKKVIRFLCACALVVGVLRPFVMLLFRTDQSSELTQKFRFKLQYKIKLEISIYFDYLFQDLNRAKCKYSFGLRTSYTPVNG